MATQLDRKRAYTPPPIPDRLYFKIGDVAELCGVETYVLRFWESQFPQLKPNKSGTGQRLYRRRDVEMAMEIKRLVHAEGYTISGARSVLEQAHRRTNRRSSSVLEPVRALEAKSALPPAPDQARETDSIASAIGHARAELRELVGLLSSPVTEPMRRRGRLSPIREASGLLFPSEV